MFRSQELPKSFYPRSSCCCSVVIINARQLCSHLNPCSVEHAAHAEQYTAQLKPSARLAYSTLMPFLSAGNGITST
jgi:hypothetical protein